jgi:amino acid transporter
MDAVTISYACIALTHFEATAQALWRREFRRALGDLVQGCLYALLVLLDYDSDLALRLARAIAVIAH